jgi:hypothetical protein
MQKKEKKKEDERWVTIKANQYQEMQQRLKAYDHLTAQLREIENEIESVRRQLIEREVEGEIPELTKKDRILLDYIKNNPGITKQQLVKGLDGTYSRGPIFNSLKNLEEWDMIDVRKDKPNSQIHHLFVKEDNPILLAEENLNEFNKAFFRLLYHSEEEELLFKTLDIYRQFVNAYILTALARWPYQMNRITLETIHKTVFLRTVDIQSILIETLGDRPKDKHILEIYCKKLIQSLSYKPLLLSPKDFNTTFEFYKKRGLSSEIGRVLDCLWKICLPLFETAMLVVTETNENSQKEEGEKKDWRTIK